MATLRHVLLLQRDVPRAARFYSEGLGLPVAVLTERWAELRAGSTSLALKAVDGCAAFCLARVLRRPGAWLPGGSGTCVGWGCRQQRLQGFSWPRA